MILGDILGVNASTPSELRAWWRQHRSANRALNAFAALADDQASPEQWLEAADFLTLPAGTRWSNGTRSAAETECDPKVDRLKLNGDELRSRKDPSLSDLLVKRTLRLIVLRPELVCAMSVKAALWDLSASLPALRKAAEIESCRADSLVAIARLSAGDTAAATDWASGIRERASSPMLRPNDPAPLWMFPRDAVLQNVSEQLFTQDDSPLSPAHKPFIVHSPLLAVSSYRQSVLAALSDTTVIGTATRSIDGDLSYSAAGGGGGSHGGPHDTRQVPPGQTRPVRVKDLAAFQLSAVFENVPKFELDWPESDKDPAIAEIAAYLKAHADELRAFPAKLSDTSCPVGTVYLKQQ
jgi:hypothetical protein